MADEKEHGTFSSRIKTTIHATKAEAKKFADAADRIFRRRTVRVLAAVVLFAVVVALLWLFLNGYVAPTKPSEKKDLVLAMAQILAGTALLSGLYFTWRTLQVNREGQITEGFTRAIDQLGKIDEKGNKLFEIRLGGIYALERIARESEEDHWPIMEVLTAYVRRQSTLRRSPDPDPDIQAIMSVIRRRIRHFSKGEPEFIDLHETDLQGANLYKANLYGADLHGAKLSEAKLSEAKLYGANLEEANLEGSQSFIPGQLEEATGVRDECTVLRPHLRTDVDLASGSSYQLEPGDTLWGIAVKTYNNGKKWRKIHRANDWILDPERIQANWWIWIPRR